MAQGNVRKAGVELVEDRRRNQLAKFWIVADEFIKPIIVCDTNNQPLATIKDGDVVVWTDNPLSIYAKSLYTIVDGTIYFDRQHDEQMQKEVDAERNRLVRKMNSEKRSGAPVIPAQPTYQIIHTCNDDGHTHGILEIDTDDTDGIGNNN